MRAMLARY